jgi:hypothetical protein
MFNQSGVGTDGRKLTAWTSKIGWFSAALDRGFVTNAMDDGNFTNDAAISS